MSREEMRWLTVLSYKKDTRALMRRLMYLRCVDIQCAELEGEGFTLECFDVSEDKARAEEKLCAIVRAQEELCGYRKRRLGFDRRRKSVDISGFITGERYGRAQTAVKETEMAARELSELCESAKEKRALYESLLTFRAYPRPLGLRGTEYTEIILGSLPADTDYSAFLRSIEDFYATAERVLYKEGSDIFVCVICHVSDVAALMEMLSSYGFVRAEFPEGYSRASRKIERVKKEILELELRIEQTKARLSGLADQLDDIDILYDVEKTTLNIIESQAMLAQTEHTDVLCAWVPKSETKRIILSLEAFDAAYELRAPYENETPPILLKGLAGALARSSLLQRIGLFKGFYKGGGKPHEALLPSEKYTVEK